MTKPKPKVPRRGSARHQEDRSLPADDTDRLPEVQPATLPQIPVSAPRVVPSAAAIEPDGIHSALRKLAAQECPAAKVPSPRRHRARWLGGLSGEAAVAVATPLLTAAVDGLGLLIAAMTVWELWRPVEAMADAVLKWSAGS